MPFPVRGAADHLGGFQLRPALARLPLQVAASVLEIVPNASRRRIFCPLGLDTDNGSVLAGAATGWDRVEYLSVQIRRTRWLKLVSRARAALLTQLAPLLHSVS